MRETKSGFSRTSRPRPQPAMAKIRTRAARATATAGARLFIFRPPLFPNFKIIIDFSFLFGCFREFFFKPAGTVTVTEGTGWANTSGRGRFHPESARPKKSSQPGARNPGPPPVSLRKPVPPRFHPVVLLHFFLSFLVWFVYARPVETLSFDDPKCNAPQGMPCLRMSCKKSQYR